MNTGKTNQATAETFATIAYNCDNVLSFFQAMAVKLPQVTAAPLSIHAGKRAYLVMSLDRHKSHYAAQDGPPRSHRSHRNLDRRGNQATNRGSNPPCRCIPERGRKGDQGMRPSPTDVLARCPVGKLHQQISIPTSPLPNLHRFLNARNLTDLQADCALTYAGNNLYLPTSLCQALPQGHILAIPDLDIPTGLPPHLTPLSSAGPVNAQKGSIKIQILLSMGQDFLSKE